MRPDLGDVVARARGLRAHLLSRQVLERLAGAGGSGVLAGALQAGGYPPAPRELGVPLSAAEAIDASIECECARRLELLARWLGPRRALFAAVFEDEERRALRICLRRVVSGAARARRQAVAAGMWALPRRLREQLVRASDATELARALARSGSAYGEAIARAVHEQGESVAALEAALDRAFARRASQTSGRLGGRLLAWVRDALDLENAWDAVVGGGGVFVEGGCRLSRERHEKIASEPLESSRRRRLAEVFARTSLSAVFDDPEVPLAALEGRAVAARIRAERHAARVDPIGAAPVLEFVLQLRAERGDLRRINWGIAQGLTTEAIVGGMVVAR